VLHLHCWTGLAGVAGVTPGMGMGIGLGFCKQGYPIDKGG